MTKSSISAALMTVLFATPMMVHGAYPVYQQQQMPQQVIYQQPGVQPMVYQQPGGQPMVYQQPGVVMPANRTVAAGSTRVTGALPRVGSNSTNAGRQYYQPVDYDRLADSGLYMGLSIGYAASTKGAMSADYRNEFNAFFVPGAFEEANFRSDAVMPLQLSLGAAINNDVRVDFSYLRYRRVEYADTVMSSDGMGGYTETRATGGAITSNATMLNVYYNVDSYTGFLAGGALRPYVGIGVGISLNTISDYVILDASFYSEGDPSYTPPGGLTGISDIYAYHNGGTTEQLAYMFEGGVTTELEGGIKLDFFMRYSGLGKIRSSGSIVVTQTEWLATGDPNVPEQPAPYDSVFHYTNWYESGSLSTIDLGVRMRLQF